MARTPPKRSTLASSRNPLAIDPHREHRVRERAYYLWEADGKPHGHDVEYWERARELVGMEESAGSGLLPNPESVPLRVVGIEEADIQANLGEFPGLMTDQGEDQPTPAAKRRPRAKPKKPA
jgi:Protein of unknown function (DUF2934)